MSNLWHTLAKLNMIVTINITGKSSGSLSFNKGHGIFSGDFIQ